MKLLLELEKSTNKLTEEGSKKHNQTSEWGGV